MTSLTKDKTMTSATTDITPHRATGATGNILSRVLERMAGLSPTYRRVAELSAMSDADLAAKGTTRHAVALRIFGNRLYN